MLRDYYLSWLKSKWMWALAAFIALWIFVPSVLATIGSAAWYVTRQTVSTTTEVASDAYRAGSGVVRQRTEPGPASHGATHTVEVTVTFDVNRGYHGWGQLLRSYHQLPEIEGRVYAARIVNGRVESLLPSDTSLLAQRRLNWRSTARMEWTDVRATVGEESTHLCVELAEVTEGHNILGHIDDALHFVPWVDADGHLTSGDAPVASGECVELRHRTRIDRDGSRHRDIAPYDFPATRMRRPGETAHTGTLTVRWEGPLG